VTAVDGSRRFQDKRQAFVKKALSNVVRVRTSDDEFFPVKRRLFPLPDITTTAAATTTENTTSVSYL